MAPEQEAALATALRNEAEGSPAWVEARNALAVSGMDTARRVAATYAKRCSLSQDDLEGAAFEGLLTAAAKHDPARGPFRGTARTYAAKFILEAIGEDRPVRLSARAIREQGRIVRALRGRQQAGQVVTDEALAADCGLTVARVAELRSAAVERPLSLDLPNDDGLTLADAVAGPTADDPSPVAVARQLAVSRLLACLTPRWARAVRLSLGLGVDVDPVTGKRYAAAWERHPHRARQFAREGVEHMREIVRAMPEDERARIVEDCGL